MKNYMTGLVVALAAIAVTAVPATAAPFAGTAGSFSFSLDDSSPWGTPSVVGALGNTLLFNGAGFNVDSTGVSNPTSNDDHVEITVNSNPGLAVGVINVTAFGSLNLNGAGSSVDFELTFDVDDLDTLASTSQDVTPAGIAFPLVAGQNSVPNVVNNLGFTAVNSLDISSVLGFSGENIMLDLRAVTEALGGPNGGTSNLQVNVSALEMQFFFVPEPATLSLLAFGGIALIRRRR